MQTYKYKILTALISASLLAGCGGGGTTSSYPGNDTNNSTSGDDTNDTQPVTPPKPKLSGWYLRTVAKATKEGVVYIHKTAGVFGELEESSDTLDKHDIPALEQATLQVRFINKQLDPDKKYFSDYRHYDASTSETRKLTWSFIVENSNSLIDLSDASLQISVEDLRDIYKPVDNFNYIEKISPNQQKRDKLTLIDLDNNESYSYNDLQNISLNMDGKHIRQFRWVLGDIDNDDFTPIYSNKKLKSQKIIQKSQNQSKFGVPPTI